MVELNSGTGRNVHDGQNVHQGPLSFRDFLGIKLDRAQAGEHGPVHVQFRKRGMTLCGTVIQAAPAQDGAGSDWFQIDGQIGVCWVPHANVRLCSGDGRCMCEADAAESGACAGSAASAVPPGNTGTTIGAGA